MNKNKRRNPAKKPTVTTVQQRTQFIDYSGMLPPPKLIKEFNEHIPNGADRIMTIAENQAGHRLSMEKYDIILAYFGLFFAFILALAILTGSIFLLYKGKSYTGLTVFFTSIIGLISSIIFSKQKSNKNINQVNK